MHETRQHGVVSQSDDKEETTRFGSGLGGRESARVLRVIAHHTCKVGLQRTQRECLLDGLIFIQHTNFYLANSRPTKYPHNFQSQGIGTPAVKPDISWTEAPIRLNGIYAREQIRIPFNGTRPVRTFREIPTFKAKSLGWNSAPTLLQTIFCCSSKVISSHIVY